MKEDNPHDLLAKWLLAQDWRCEWCNTPLTNIVSKHHENNAYQVIGRCKKCDVNLMWSRPITEERGE